MKKKAIVTSMAMLFGTMAAAPAMAAEVEVSGAVETEFYSVEFGDLYKEMEITLATVELGFDAKVDEKVDAHLLFLYEEGEGDGPVMDEGTITYKLGGGSSVTMGKTYVPFGVYETAIISDPVTLGLGETNEVVLMYSNSTGMFNIDLYAFNGDIDTIDAVTNNENTDMGYGVNVGLSQEDVYSVSLGYISNIGDTDTVSDYGGFLPMDAFIAGYAVSANVSMGPATLMVEHVSAMDAFTAADLGGALTDMTPSATMVDVAFDVQGVTLGVSYQSTSEAVGMLPMETGFGVAAHFGIADDTNLGVEFASWDDYAIADGGTGESGSQILVQLATEF